MRAPGMPYINKILVRSWLLPLSESNKSKLRTKMIEIITNRAVCLQQIRPLWLRMSKTWTTPFSSDLRTSSAQRARRSPAKSLRMMTSQWLWTNRTKLSAMESNRLKKCPSQTLLQYWKPKRLWPRTNQAWRWIKLNRISKCHASTKML
jgi:hypothetical protein